MSDALVDDVRVEGREDQRARDLHEREPDHREQRVPVAGQERAQEPEQLHGDTSDAAASDAVEEQRDDLRGRQRLVEDEGGMGAGDGEPAQEVRRLQGIAPDPGSVRLEHCCERRKIGRPVLVGRGRSAARHLQHPERRPQLPDVGHPAPQDLDGLHEPGLEGERGVDRPEGRVGRGGVEGRFDDRLDERFLVREDPEDRAFGDAGSLRDLAGGDRGAVRQHQGKRRLDDLGPALRGRERSGPGAAGGGRHRPILYE